MAVSLGRGKSWVGLSLGTAGLRFVLNTLCPQLGGASYPLPACFVGEGDSKQGDYVQSWKWFLYGKTENIIKIKIKPV